VLLSRLQAWNDEAACREAAVHLASRPALHDACIELQGPLGAGKTTFARHLLQALGVSGRVKSPSYAIVEPYELPGLSIWHFDFYRFNDPHEWEDAGLRDMFAAPGLKLVEWAEQARSLLPVPDVQIAIQPAPPPLGADRSTDAPRDVQWQAYTPRGVELLS
jgi:tRNA threonylcarbamoyladenosine biosynthesis protein TsaE